MCCGEIKYLPCPDRKRMNTLHARAHLHEGPLLRRRGGRRRPPWRRPPPRARRRLVEHGQQGRGRRVALPRPQLLHARRRAVLRRRHRMRPPKALNLRRRHRVVQAHRLRAVERRAALNRGRPLLCRRVLPERGGRRAKRGRLPPRKLFTPRRRRCPRVRDVFGRRPSLLSLRPLRLVRDRRPPSMRWWRRLLGRPWW